MNPMIAIQDVSFCYQESETPSLNQVSLNVQRGEVVVLCGKSGCGKSTLIRLINGLIPFYYKGKGEGRVTINGRDTREGSIYDLGCKVSMVFQNPRSQFFCVDVRSELAFGAENLNFPKEEIWNRIELASREFNLEHFLGRTMFQLSGGEKQKIACASVSITDNPIVVLDEPSSNLDGYAVSELKKMVEYWKQKGKTVVIAEHRLHYLLDVADRFVYLKEGKICGEFQKGELQKQPEEKRQEMGLRNLSFDHLTVQNRKKATEWMKIDGFSFRYKGARELQLSIPELDIPKASVIAVIGKNGAGKSTFVRCLCGLERKAKGVLVDDGVAYRAKKRLEHSFLVMQDVNRQLFTESVEEEILLSMEKGREDALLPILEEFDLQPYQKQHPMSLSGGQKQRVAVASAVASRRDYIVFDEPTSGLDYFHMRQVADCIRKLQEQGKTIFLITHDLELLYACCNYVLHIKQGTVQDFYPLSEDILHSPLYRKHFLC